MVTTVSSPGVASLEEPPGHLAQDVQGDDREDEGDGEDEHDDGVPVSVRSVVEVSASGILELK